MPPPQPASLPPSSPSSCSTDPRRAPVLRPRPVPAPHPPDTASKANPDRIAPDSSGGEPAALLTGQADPHGKRPSHDPHGSDAGSRPPVELLAPHQTQPMTSDQRNRAVAAWTALIAAWWTTHPPD